MGGRQMLTRLLSAEAISLTGTAFTMVALPWFVRTTTGSTTLMGLVAFCEMAPYVASKTFGGPLIDQVGPQRVSVAADVSSAIALAAVPLLHAADALPIPVLLGLVAIVGTSRGPSDAAKATLVPRVASAAEVPLERITGLHGAIERLPTIVGPAIAAASIAWIGALPVLLIDAATFLIAAAVIATIRGTARVPDEPDSTSTYAARLREGLRFLYRDRLLRAMVAMVAATNLLDAALLFVLLPTWADERGFGPGAVGAVISAMSATAVAGSLLASAVGDRLPRRATFLVAFLIGGAPRFLILATGAGVIPVVGVYLVAGVSTGLINPILSAVIYERIPSELLGRVWSLVSSLMWVGIPIGGVVAGTLEPLVGLDTTFVVCGCAFTVTTIALGLRREWGGMDAAHADSSAPPRSVVSRRSHVLSQTAGPHVRPE